MFKSQIIVKHQKHIFIFIVAICIIKISATINFKSSVEERLDYMNLEQTSLSILSKIKNNEDMNNSSTDFCVIALYLNKFFFKQKRYNLDVRRNERQKIFNRDTSVDTKKLLANMNRLLESFAPEEKAYFIELPFRELRNHPTQIITLISNLVTEPIDTSNITFLEGDGPCLDNFELFYLIHQTVVQFFYVPFEESLQLEYLTIRNNWEAYEDLNKSLIVEILQKVSQSGTNEFKQQFASDVEQYFNINREAVQQDYGNIVQLYEGNKFIKSGETKMDYMIDWIATLYSNTYLVEGFKNPDMNSVKAFAGSTIFESAKIGFYKILDYITPGVTGFSELTNSVADFGVGSFRDAVLDKIVDSTNVSAHIKSLYDNRSYDELAQSKDTYADDFMIAAFGAYYGKTTEKVHNVLKIKAHIFTKKRNIAILI